MKLSQVKLLKICSFIVVLFGVITCKKQEQPTPPEPPIKLGAMISEPLKELITKEIPSTGGTINVSGSGTKADGLKIDIPTGSYSKNNTIKIAVSSILNHTFGEYFNPVSSLIHIEDNITDISNKLITISIPIQLPEGHFASAFAFNADESLELLPTVLLEKNRIVIQTNQLSTIKSFKNGRITVTPGLNIIVTSVSQDKLDQLTFNSTFTPTVDDWEFANYGTEYSPKGIPNGMAIGAYYYFTNIKSKTGKQLFGNDQLGKYLLPASIGNDKDILWMDNALGLTFASKVEVLREGDKLFPYQEYFPNNFQKNSYDILTFYNISYNWLLNAQKDPQLLGLYDKTSNVIVTVVVTGKTKTDLLIADPNFPGTTRTLSFDRSSGFKNYDSGLLATKIKKFDQFAWLSPVFINKTELDNYWTSVNNRTLYPINSFVNEYEISTANGKQKLVDGMAVATSFNVIGISNKVDDQNVDFSLVDTKGNKIPERSKQNPYGLSADGIRFYELPAGTNTLGVYRKTKYSLDGEFKWADFKWFTINSEELSISSSTGAPINQQGQVDTDYVFKVGGSTYKPTSDTQFEWDFGDNTPPTKVTGIAEVKHSFKRGGIFTITLKIKTGNIVSVIMINVNIKSNAPTQGYVTINMPDLYEIREGTPTQNILQTANVYSYTFSVPTTGSSFISNWITNVDYKKTSLYRFFEFSGKESNINFLLETIKVGKINLIQQNYCNGEFCSAFDLTMPLNIFSFGYNYLISPFDYKRVSFEITNIIPIDVVVPATGYTLKSVVEGLIRLQPSSERNANGFTNSYLQSKQTKFSTEVYSKDEIVIKFSMPLYEL
ncbi:PKD domain-containing protein [Fibrella aquatilis]|uniref:PKD domain-containing protein n=1 Tax=Fibrella aquatilis TaxID=2817059 RepID=A0A939K027_9BACT|nr:PKD domain-containing protein [Fibrella aquatilis]MBO0933759.1 hypothetical protein [Fibrella aquatilis]